MDENKLQDILFALKNNLDKNIDNSFTELLTLHPTEIAQVISAIGSNERTYLWSKIDNTTKANIIKELTTEISSALIGVMSDADIADIAEKMAIDDLADIVPLMPEGTVHNLLLTIDNKHRQNLKKVLSYPYDSAGGLMNTDIITLRANVSVRTVIRYLRLLGVMPKNTDKLFIVDRNFLYLGSIHIAVLLSADADKKIDNLIDDKAIKAIKDSISDNEVVTLFEQRDLISAPVVDNNNKLIGRITIDDVVDVMREQSEHSVKSMVGLGEEELFSPVLKSAKNRFIWLGINLITAFFAVFFIDIFAETIEKKIALAVLLPIVASMGGIAGMQSLILITRGLAIGAINLANIRFLLNKELLISILNSILLSLLVAIITYFWFIDLTLSFVILVAIIINMFSAAIFGVLLPFFLIKVKIDPALAGGVVLTTITDSIGFIVFLGFASIIF